MNFPRTLPLLVLIGLVLGPCGAAQAASVAPPGNSGADQYFETVPAAGGSQPSGAPHRPPAGSGSAISDATRRALAAAGADGRAAADLAAAGAPARPKTGGSPAGAAPAIPAGPSAVVQLPPVGGGPGSSGISLLLPIVLGATLLGAIALALIRRRRTPPPPM